MKHLTKGKEMTITTTRSDHIALAQECLAYAADSALEDLSWRYYVAAAAAHAAIAQAMRPVILFIDRDCDPDLIRRQVEGAYGTELA